MFFEVRKAERAGKQAHKRENTLVVALRPTTGIGVGPLEIDAKLTNCYVNVRGEAAGWQPQLEEETLVNYAYHDSLKPVSKSCNHHRCGLSLLGPGQCLQPRWSAVQQGRARKFRRGGWAGAGWAAPAETGVLRRAGLRRGAFVTATKDCGGGRKGVDICWAGLLWLDERLCRISRGTFSLNSQKSQITAAL